MHAFGFGVRIGAVAQKKFRIDMISWLVWGEFDQTSFPPFVPSTLQLALGVIFLSCFFLFLLRSFYPRFPLNIVLKLILILIFFFTNSDGFNEEDLR